MDEELIAPGKVWQNEMINEVLEVFFEVLIVLFKGRLK
jgi:hypothetical protein